MDAMLNLDIYGLKVRINFASRREKGEVAGLLRLFLRDENGEADVSLDFKKTVTRQEIARHLFPFLAERGIWAIHSGGFHYKGGHLTVGPSNCGKSTFSYMAMKHGLSLLSDDIALVRDAVSGIEILPFYSAIYLKHEVIFPDSGLFRPVALTSLLLPRFGNGSLRVRKIERRIDLLRQLVPQFLWSYNSKEQEKQRRFLEKMCHYPAFEVYWNDRMFDDHRLFGNVLDEIVQG
jgi:hypothetical protein